MVTFYNIAHQFCSLKRKSTTMAKRQSFILEPKHFDTNKSSIKQLKLPSKIFHSFTFFFIFFFMPFFLIMYRIPVTEKQQHNNTVSL